MTQRIAVNHRPLEGRPAADPGLLPPTQNFSLARQSRAEQAGQKRRGKHQAESPIVVPLASKSAAPIQAPRPPHM